MEKAADFSTVLPGEDVEKASPEGNKMIRKNTKNIRLHRSQEGRFSLTYWQSEWECFDNAESQRDSNYRRQIELKVCLQWGRYNRQTQTWHNQQIWCYPDELRDLQRLLEKPQEEETVTSTP